MKRNRKPEILCLGPTGCGKTLLLKKLEGIHKVDETTSSIPTTGVSLFKIPLENGKFINVKELGGHIAPIWHHYYSTNVDGIIYVVDASNLCSISAAGILLYSLITETCLKKAKILLVLSKMDVSYRQMRNEALLILQIEKLKSQISQEITIIECSALNDTGTKAIKDWINHFIFSTQ